MTPTATNVHLTDTWPSDLTFVSASTASGTFDSGTGLWTIGTLAKDASVTLTLTGTVKAVVEGKVITNSVSAATSDQSDPLTLGDDLSESVTVDKPPVATNDSATFTPGSAATVKVVANDTTGDTVVASTVVFTSTSATDGGKTLVVANQGTWSIDATSGAITFTPLAGFVGNPTAVEYKVADAQGNFDTATVTLAKGAADLSLSKTVNNASPNVGENVTFTLSLTNAGPDAATNVKVNDSLPAGLTYVSDSGNGAYRGGVWTVGTLANGDTATLTIVARADSSSIVINSATVDGDQTDTNSANDTSSASVDGVEPALAVNSISVNEGSPYAVFTVTGKAGQKVQLLLQSGTAIVGVDTAPSLEYFDGANWQSYKPGSYVPIPAVGSTLLVRTAIVNDTTYEGAETFELVATNVEAKAATGTCTIHDDGTGTYYPDAKPANGVPAKDPNAVLDDDRPIPPLRPVVVPPIQPAPPEIRQSEPHGEVIHFESLTRPPVEPVKELPSLTLVSQIPEQYTDSGAKSSFAIPKDAFAHSDPTAVINLSASLAGGQKLPDWIRFDANSGTFRFEAPANFVGELRIKVTALDSKGNEASTIFRFIIGKKKEAGKESNGRVSLSEQLRQADRDPRFAAGRLDAKIGARVHLKKVG